MTTCSHAGTVDLDVEPVPPVGPDGRRTCGACVAAGTGWVHLRRCTTCGSVGCCDSSPMRHATEHAHDTGHPVVQSFEPGEDWLWCYVDRTGLRL